jgi:hypothetical protein
MQGGQRGLRHPAAILIHHCLVLSRTALFISYFAVWSTFDILPI